MYAGTLDHLARGQHDQIMTACRGHIAVFKAQAVVNGSKADAQRLQQFAHLSNLGLFLLHHLLHLIFAGGLAAGAAVQAFQHLVQIIQIRTANLGGLLAGLQNGLGFKAPFCRPFEIQIYFVSGGIASGQSQMAQHLFDAIPRRFRLFKIDFRILNGQDLLIHHFGNLFFRCRKTEVDTIGYNHVLKQHQHHFLRQLLVFHPFKGQRGFLAMNLAAVAEQRGHCLTKRLVFLILRHMLALHQHLLHGHKTVAQRFVRNALHQPAAFPVAHGGFNLIQIQFQSLRHFIQQVAVVRKAAVHAHQPVQIDFDMVFRRGGHVLAEKGVGYSRGSPQKAGTGGFKGWHVRAPFVQTDEYILVYHSFVLLEIFKKHVKYDILSSAIRFLKGRLSI